MRFDPSDIRSSTNPLLKAPHTHILAILQRITTLNNRDIIEQYLYRNNATTPHLTVHSHHCSPWHNVRSSSPTIRHLSTQTHDRQKDPPNPPRKTPRQICKHVKHTRGRHIPREPAPRKNHQGIVQIKASNIQQCRSSMEPLVLLEVHEAKRRWRPRRAQAQTTMR